MVTTRRMRTAARHAYYIRLDGTVGDPVGEAGPPVDYIAPPRAISAGDFGIDAGFVAPVAEGVLISIRGTTPPLDPTEPAPKVLLDWIQNTGAQLTPAGGDPPGFPGKVHFGFYQSYTKIWAKLWPLVSAAIAAHPQHAIFITGHSKGGPICALIAWRLHLDFPGHTIKVRTFGAARCGDAVFAAAYNAAIDHVRYEYDEDLVPHLPMQTSAAAALLGASTPLAAFLTTVDAGYGDVGRLGYINTAGNIVGGAPASEIVRVPLLLAKLGAPGGAAYVFSCHNIAYDADGYVKAVYPD